jgi:predicted metal-dependent phosphoesterase TrpH
MIRADLHIHSTTSDGSETVDEIIKMAFAKGLTHIAITDHDTLEHKKHIPFDAPIKVTCGVEISAIDRKSGTKAHILGYSIANMQYIERICTPILKARHQNCLKQISILEKHGFRIDIEAIRKADNRYIYKQHIMDYLFRTNQVADMFGHFYHSVFKNGGICDFDIDYADVHEAVIAVKKGNGYAVLSHPGQQQNLYLIEKLVPFGLDGIELNHPGNSIKDIESIMEYSQKYNLILTGGSDFHGRFESQKIDIGDYLADKKAVEVIFDAQ